MRTRKFKAYKHSKKINYKIIIIIVVIMITNFLIVNYIGTGLTPVVEEIVKINVDKSIHNYLYNMFSVNTLEQEELMNIIDIKYNSDGEVVTADYRFDLAYKYLSDEMTNVFNNIRNMNVKMEYYDYEDSLFFVPLGIIDKGNILITDFGMKLPCKVIFFSDVRMYFKTKVNDYGLNNLLVELYLVVDVKNEILSPSTFSEFGKTYEIIMASKVVVGKIPAYYGSSLEKSSAIVSS